MRILDYALRVVITCLSIAACAVDDQPSDEILELTPDDKADGSAFALHYFERADDSVTLRTQCREWRNCDVKFQLWADDEDVLRHARAYFQAHPGETHHDVVLANVAVTIDDVADRTYAFRARAVRAGDAVEVDGITESFFDNGRERIRISSLAPKARLTFRITPSPAAIAAGWLPMELTSLAAWW